jgi:AcrR family transcriptional regulator
MAVMAKGHQAIEIKRRIPHQARAGATVAAILEAAAQILEAGGLAAFNTNAVAERAGVSIGTLYQYFADKNAIVLALAKREMQAALADIGHVLADTGDATPGHRVRAMVRVMINAFRGRQRARRAVMQAVLAQSETTSELMAPLLAFIATAGARVGQWAAPAFAALSPEQVFVLSRAMMGAVRAAVLEDQPFLRSRAFEDEIVRLVLAYLSAVTDEARRDPGRTIS